MSHNAAPTVSGASISNTNKAVDAGANLSTIPFLSPVSNNFIAGQASTGIPTTLHGHAAEVCIPVRFGTTLTFNAISLLVQTAGSTGAVVRFGLRADGSAQPGTLISDYGTFASTSNSTYIGPTGLSVTLNAHTTYWLTFTPQNTAQDATPPTTLATIRYQNPPYLQTHYTSPNTQAHHGWRTTTAVNTTGTTTGALPSSITIPATGRVVATESVGFWLRFA